MNKKVSRTLRPPRCAHCPRLIELISPFYGQNGQEVYWTGRLPSSRALKVLDGRRGVFLAVSLKSKRWLLVQQFPWSVLS